MNALLAVFLLGTAAEAERLTLMKDALVAAERELEVLSVRLSPLSDDPKREMTARLSKCRATLEEWSPAAPASIAFGATETRIATRVRAPSDTSAQCVLRMMLPPRLVIERGDCTGYEDRVECVLTLSELSRKPGAPPPAAEETEKAIRARIDETLKATEALLSAIAARDGKSEELKVFIDAWMRSGLALGKARIAAGRITLDGGVASEADRKSLADAGAAGRVVVETAEALPLLTPSAKGAIRFKALGAPLSAVALVLADPATPFVVRSEKGMRVSGQGAGSSRAELARAFAGKRLVPIAKTGKARKATVEIQDADARGVLTMLGQLALVDVFAPPALEGMITIAARDVPADAVIAGIARAFDLVVVEQPGAKWLLPKGMKPAPGAGARLAVALAQEKPKESYNPPYGWRLAATLVDPARSTAIFDDRAGNTIIIRAFPKPAFYGVAISDRSVTFEQEMRDYNGRLVMQKETVPLRPLPSSSQSASP